jgi:hypothetical protein
MTGTGTTETKPPGTRSSDGIVEDIFGQAGFSTAFSLDPGELAFLRDAIAEQWMARIEEIYPGHVAAFRAAGMTHYHRLSHLVSHENLWRKPHRILPMESVVPFTRFDSIRNLMSALGGGCRISDVTLFSGNAPAHPEVCWRLVRPDVPTDVGGMHTDKSFEKVLNSGQLAYAEDESTIKMWIAVHTVPGLNGLYMVPGSHRRTWRFAHRSAADGYERPVLDEPLGEYTRELVPTSPGQALLFHEDLLHGGAVNTAPTCRVSLELTFVIPHRPLIR